MLRLARGIEHSLSSLSSYELIKQREEAIKTLPTPAERLGALTVHKLVVLYPDAAKKIANVLLYGTEFEYIGGGADTGVYKVGSHVVKIVRGSSLLSESQRQKDVARRETQHAQLRKSLGRLVPLQYSFVGAHPLQTGHRATQVIQPFIEFELLELVKPNQPALTTELAQKAISKYPGIDSAIEDFLEASNKYHELTDNYPDINGSYNLVVSRGTPELTLLDTVPIGPSFRSGQELIVAQHESLHRALN